MCAQLSFQVTDGKQTTINNLFGVYITFLGSTWSPFIIIIIIYHYRFRFKTVLMPMPYKILLLAAHKKKKQGGLEFQTRAQQRVTFA